MDSLIPSNGVVSMIDAKPSSSTDIISSMSPNVGQKICCEKELIPTEFSVIHQYSLEDIASSQCSWFCVEMFLQLKRDDWVVDESKIVEKYNQCLIDASNKRKTYGKLLWGESLFSSTIHSVNNHELPIGNISMCVVNGDKPRNLLVSPEMRDIQKYKESLPFITFLTICKNIHHLFGDKKFIMINRFGQSFGIFPKNPKEYYIFDSHTSKIMIKNEKDVINYILMDPSSFNFIIYVEGFCVKQNMSLEISKKLYKD
jgi:hypothetical protein